MQDIHSIFCCCLDFQRKIWCLSSWGSWHFVPTAVNIVLFCLLCIFVILTICTECFFSGHVYLELYMSLMFGCPLLSLILKCSAILSVKRYQAYVAFPHYDTTSPHTKSISKNHMIEFKKLKNPYNFVLATCVSSCSLLATGWIDLHAFNVCITCTFSSVWILRFVSLLHTSILG